MKSPTVSHIHNNKIISKAREYQRHQRASAVYAPFTPVTGPAEKLVVDPMNTKEACAYLGVCKTTLMAYEADGLLKATRTIRPGKKRGKNKWTKVELDKIRFGVCAQN